MKSRMEALERFREATTTTQMMMSDMNSSNLLPSKESNRHYFEPMLSPAMSPSSNSYGSQGQCSSTRFSTPMSSSSQTRPDNATTPVTPTMDSDLAIKSHHDQVDGMWDLGQAMSIGLSVEDMEESRDATYHQTPEMTCPDLIKEVSYRFLRDRPMRLGSWLRQNDGR
jgi:hypothetical protein